jgi:hypothetical protein
MECGGEHAEAGEHQALEQLDLFAGGIWISSATS